MSCMSMRFCWNISPTLYTLFYLRYFMQEWSSIYAIGCDLCVTVFYFGVLNFVWEMMVKFTYSWGISNIVNCYFDLKNMCINLWVCLSLYCFCFNLVSLFQCHIVIWSSNVLIKFSSHLLKDMLVLLYVKVQMWDFIW